MRIAETSALFLAYVVLSEVSYAFVFPPSHNAVFWLPSGLTLGLFLRTPRARWSWWLVALFFGELTVVLRHDVVPAVAVAWSVANCLLPLAAASLLLSGARGRFELARVRDVVAFALGTMIAAVPGAVLTAVAAWLWLDGELGPAVLSWWSSDALGAILLAPLILAYSGREPMPSGRGLEAAILGATLVAVATAIFGTRAPHPWIGSLPYLLLPLTAWAAVRFGTRGAATATVVLDILAVWHTLRGRGPFASLDASGAARVLDVQVFVAVLSVFGLMLAAAVVQERAARGEAQAAERRSAFIAEATALMSESLDYAEELRRLARLCVRSLADWCVIDLVQGGEIRAVGGAHADASKERLVHDLQHCHPPSWRSSQLAAVVVSTGAPVLIPEAMGAIRRARWDDEALIRELGTSTAMAVPLAVRGSTIGAISLASAKPGRRYGPADLALAEELARRASIAIDNASLYRDAQEAIRQRDEFLSVASHELNTPLTSLLLSVQAIESGLVTSPEMVRRSLGLVGRQARSLGRLVEELLGVSRIVAGRLHLELEDLELGGLVREVAGRFEEDRNRRACDLSVHADRPVTGRWDRLRLEQVVANLLSNAIKFGAGQPIDIEVAAADGTATLVVHDHGIGIPSEKLERVFDRFERAVSARSYGGLGLGLYIVRSIVQAHGGDVRAASAVGQGTTFTVTLPRRGTSAVALQATGTDA